MRYAIISGGVVVNVVIADSANAFDENVTAVQTDEAGIGWEYSNGAFSEPTAGTILLTDEQLSAEARAKRDALIAETDYLLMTDYPIADEKLMLVKTYRQLLRDIPKQAGFPTDIDWPPIP